MYTEVTSWENLLQAFKNASRGKRGHPDVAEFEYRLEDNILLLQHELQQQNYQPGRYQSFYIHEPKQRLISAAPFRDRVVHHALCQIIEPIFEASFISDSYANRIGKGTHRALNRTQYFSRRFKYVLQCDLKQFFPSIDSAILKQILSKKILDKDVLWLIDQIITSGNGINRETYEMVYFPKDDLFAINRPRGLPIGNLTSQFWANVFLNPFDHFVKRELRCPAYVRYVDDFLLFSNEKQELWHWKKVISRRLEKFRLILHSGAQPRPVTEGIPFLGFRIFPEKRRLKRRKGIYFQRKFKKMIKAYQRGALPFSETTDSVRGWINHVRYGNTVGLRKALFSAWFSTSTPRLLDTGCPAT